MEKKAGCWVHRDQVWMFLSQQAGQGGLPRGKSGLGKFLCDDWTAFGLDQLEWHGLREGRHGVESLTSAVCVHSGWCCLTHYTHRRSQLVVKPSSGLECAWSHCKNVLHYSNNNNLPLGVFWFPCREADLFLLFIILFASSWHFLQCSPRQVVKDN